MERGKGNHGPRPSWTEEDERVVLDCNRIEQAKEHIAQAFGLLNQLPHGRGTGSPETDALIEAQAGLAAARRAIDRWLSITEEGNQEGVTEHVHRFSTTGGAWRCDCGATEPRVIGPGV